MLYNRGQIVQTGLNLAGRSDLMVDGRRWLNLFLTTQYCFDWPWLRHPTTIQTIQGYQLPEDFLRSYYGKVTDGTTFLEVDECNENEFMYKKTDTVTLGRPTKMLITQEDYKVYWYPEPDKQYDVDFVYYKNPDFVDESPGADGDEPFWKENESILVQAVYVSCLQYLDDDRYMKEYEKLEAMIKDEQQKSKVNRAGHNRAPLGRSFKKRFGGQSGGYGGQYF